MHRELESVAIIRREGHETGRGHSMREHRMPGGVEMQVEDAERNEDLNSWNS